MKDELLFGRLLEKHEARTVSGGICITTSTVSGEPLSTDDVKEQGPSCPPGPVVASTFDGSF